MTTLFKITDAKGASCNGGAYQYPLPAGKKPGAWTPTVENVELCARGYHLTANPGQWWSHSSPRRLWVAEFRGELVADAGKAAVASCRLLEEATPSWPLLTHFSVIRAILAAQWRREHPVDGLPGWANLSGADLSRADLSGADLSGANLSAAYLSGADLSRADLSRAYLSGADLSRAYLSGANLSGATLSGADLSRADLSRADLSGADLSGADLNRAYLSGANLSGADLSGAYLSGADLSGAINPDGSLHP